MTNKNNRIVGPILKNLVRQIAYLYERDIITILVSSGSAIAGKEVLGDCSAIDPTTRRQVFSSVGQPRLMRHYYSMFHDFGMSCAQVLATKRDRKSTRLNSSHVRISYAVFCLKKKKKKQNK